MVSAVRTVWSLRTLHEQMIIGLAQGTFRSGRKPPVLSLSLAVRNFGAAYQPAAGMGATASQRV
jgi:hypothetical protein